MSNSRINHSKRPLAIVIAIVLIALAGAAMASLSPALDAGTLTVTFLDVGQGDSILISTDDGHHMLVDGGPRASGDKLVHALSNMGVDQLDVIVSTHPHEDHIGGLLEVLDCVKVNEIMDSAKAHTTATYESYLAKIYEKGIPFSSPRAGHSFKLGDADVNVLWPTEPLPDDVNDCSLVLGISYGKSHIMLTGDISGEVERTLVNQGRLSKVHLLKVAHHGSRTSTTQAFLNEIAPQLAVIPVGEGNDYRHPSGQVLTNLRSKDVLVYRTDRHGNVTVRLRADGRTWAVQIEKPGQDLRAISTSDVFHRNTCRYVKAIDPARMIVLHDRDQAMDADYRPCKVCNP